MMQLEDVISNFETVIDSAKNCDNAWGFVLVDYLQAAVDYIKQQMPTIMTYDEVKAAGSFNDDEYDNNKEIFIWLEEKRSVIHLASPRYNYHPELGDSEYLDFVTMTFMGSDLDRRLWQEYYGKAWRCWTARPTEEQRRAVKWE